MDSRFTWRQRLVFSAAWVALPAMVCVIVGLILGTMAWAILRDDEKDPAPKS